jgi:hypothetical protein
MFLYVVTYQQERAMFGRRLIVCSKSPENAEASVRHWLDERGLQIMEKIVVGDGVEIDDGLIIKA